MEITYHQEIIAPIDIVFDFLNDDEKMKLWMEGLETTEYPEGKNEDDPVGTIFVQTIREAGHSQQYAGIVTEYKPPELIGVQLQGNAFRVDVTYELTDRGRKTDLDYTCELVFAGLFYRIIGFLFGGLTRRILKNQMTKLKQLAEQAAVRRSPPPED
ncbi:Polyketide cyclase / dehydrase and lipid transport [Gimesia panareensis]|uniref:Polyketide cyclase / dehydrase and lipid transport n=1 Tax=Gimesia panareensis TaxID=2527978 RepID=A0A518FN85_9PLAN|nr:SRPBCC family protein [Gimesia panareensis]QDV17725.1 Polyketide cyclase / dehydrase and lipid transport [Gimesia panareensis]